VGKKIAVISVIILISGLAIMGYFLQQGRKNLFTDPYKVIPPDACIVIETVDLKSFLNSLTTGRGLFGELSKVKELNSFNQNLKYLTDLLNKQNFKRLFNEKAVLISFHPDQHGRIIPMLTMPVSGDIKSRHIKEMLGTAGIKIASEIRLNGNPVLEVPFNLSSPADTAYISLISGLMVCTSSKALAGKAGRQPGNGGDIRNVPGFTRVLMASGKNVDKLFVVFRNIPGLLRPLLSDGRKSFSDKIARLAGTAAGDIYISEDGLILSGYTECSDSTELLYKYKLLPSRDFHTYKILPSSTVLFETFILPSLNIHAMTDTSVSYEAMDLAGKLTQCTGGEVTRAIIDIKGRPAIDNTLIIYELTDRALAEQQFLAEPGATGEIAYFQPDEQVRIPVYKTPFKGLIRVLFPGFAPDFDETYFAFYDNFLVAGNSYETVCKLLYDNLLKKTLENDLNYRDFQSTLPSRAGYYFFCIPSHIIDYLSGFLNENIINALRSNKGSLNKIQAAGYQFASSNGMIYNSLSVKFKEKPREESTTEWETLLDTVASIKPFFFTNHITGAKEIFIQDLRNNTYLINAAGRVLWKVPLNERIRGPIYMIDYYRNGKYQLLFSGKNYIHLLDRNGNYVERYPVKLRSPATNSLSLFDYDNNLNYRLFIAGEDKMIYSYDKTGNVVKGWTTFRTIGNVTGEIYYFKVSGKDYIVTADDNTVYFLDRAGNKRLNLKESVIKAAGSPMRLNMGTEPSVICSAPDGTIQQIYFDGSVKKFSIKKFSVDHSFEFFDIDGDGFGEYIFIDKGILYLYNHNRSEVFTREFGSDNLGGPINFIFSSTDRKIGVFDITKNLIYLIGKNGKTMNGFPLRGASMFSVGKLSDKSGWHLIVGGTDKFLYNYKIDTETN
jgi:WD40 repeat protein